MCSSRSSSHSPHYSITCYCRDLSQKCPKVKEVFQKTSIVGSFSSNKCHDMREHGKLLVDLYESALQDLGSSCKLTQVSCLIISFDFNMTPFQDRCMAIGETHFAIMGPSASALLFDDLGICLTEAFSKVDAVRGKRELFKSHILLTSFLVRCLNLIT